MWMEEIEEFFKGYLPYYVLLFLPLFIMISPSGVGASHEFPVFRMQHFDLHGVAHGCRSAAINLEARSLDTWSTSRHCVVTKLQNLSVDQFRNIKTKAGGLLVVLPRDFKALSLDEKQNLLTLESFMLSQEVSIPVYFATWTPELEIILGDVSTHLIENDLTKSAAEAMFTSIAANGYQITISPGHPSVKKDVRISTVQGQLIGSNNEVKNPTIAIVAHYDSFGVAPELSFGADSNGSGVSILLELVRLFSELYSNPKTKGKYNLLFILSGGGKLNYQGSKKWLEDQLDSLDGSPIQDASYVMCLDTLSSGNTMYMHVSKPPKEGTAPSMFFKELKSSASRLYPSLNVEGVHKKINLADDILAWEHERYSIRRLTGFTLSTVKNYKDSTRGTILDTKGNLNSDILYQNTKVIAEALGSFIYNISEGEIFGKSMDIDSSNLDHWTAYLSSQPRSAQILSTKDNVLVQTLKDVFDKNLVDVKLTHSIPDKRDPDFQFYDITKGTMNVYSVKPAIFDLVLTVAIISYLGSIYLIVQKFSLVYTVACSLTSPKNVKVH